MHRFIVHLIRSLFALWLIFTAAFFALRLLPGDAITAALFDSGASPEVITERRQRLGLDQPPIMQYVKALSGLITGDFGVSLQDGQPVISRIHSQIGATLEIALLSLLISAVAGIGLGVAAERRSPFRRTAQVAIGLILCMPVFWTGTLAIIVFSVWLGWLPSSGNGGLRHALLPALVLGISGSGAVAQVLAQALTQT
ncbi:MAG: ABC transporter permease, partial [Anaerolinea sp.]|nr:ABC transporter permease [Anaerolinea sp.]